MSKVVTADGWAPLADLRAMTTEEVIYMAKNGGDLALIASGDFTFRAIMRYHDVAKAVDSLDDERALLDHVRSTQPDAIGVVKSLLEHFRGSSAISQREHQANQ